MGKQVRTGGSENGTLLRAVDERGPDVLLEAPKSLGQWRLRHLQFGCGAPEVSCVGDRDEEPEMTDQIHGRHSTSVLDTVPAFTGSAASVGLVQGVTRGDTFSDLPRPP